MTQESTPGWSRPLWTATGAPASLYFFVPGEPPGEGLRVSRSRHHIARFPEELQVSVHDRADDSNWFARFFSQPGLGFGVEEAFGEQAETIFNANQGLVVRGDFADQPDLGYLRDSVGVVSALLDQGGMGVLDLHSCRWWSKEDWLAHFVDHSAFAVEDFVSIVVSDDEELHPGLWAHTRGLRKFGRPDLQVRHVSGDWSGDNPMVRAVGDLLNQLADRLCQGLRIEDGETMTFPGFERRCTFRHTPDDTESPSCHFGNEVLELVDLIDSQPGSNLNLLLAEIAPERAGR